MRRRNSSDEIIHSKEITGILVSISFQSASPRWEPQISVLCEAGQQYLPQYLSEDGRWSSEVNVKVPGVSCLRDKMDLLDYCKKVS
jgi:amyloid beta A4 protein